MLYDYDKTLKILLRIYEYLQMKAKDQPHSIKMQFETHRNAAVHFLEKLHPSAGADFIWEFLVFQFYVYSEQKHERRPTPSWFLGEEAWNRWASYKAGSKWYAQEWAAKQGFKNPIKKIKYTHISNETLRRERYRMSRIAGPNYCGIKYGDNPLNEKDIICMKCPFLGDCRILYGSLNKDGKNLFQEIQEIKSETIEQKHFISRYIKVKGIKKAKPDAENDL